ncbi:hypothetical protein CHRYSEO8AT_330018 [Chryseobacterium sp. 8AT]|nr:hypothetical protein CHRYSEO8AT_330018 [Chryseobacterium sp. 8AT]
MELFLRGDTTSKKAGTEGGKSCPNQFNDLSSTDCANSIIS